MKFKITNPTSRQIMFVANRRQPIFIAPNSEIILDNEIFKDMGKEKFYDLIKGMISCEGVTVQTLPCEKLTKDDNSGEEINRSDLLDL